MMHVSDLRMYPLNDTFLHLQRFDVKIDGKLTSCIADYQAGILIVHWHAGGSRVLKMADYDNSGCAGIVAFLSEYLQEASRYTKD